MMPKLRNGKKPAGPLRGQSGFTLVEILVVMALMGVVMATVYKAMTAQQKVYSVQEQAVEIQDNLRAAMAIMVKDLRLAGCDPLGTANAGFLTATATSLRITMDVTGGDDDGEDNDGNALTDAADPDEFADGKTTNPEEDVRYSLITEADGSKWLGRDNGNGLGYVPIAQNVDEIEFYYTLADGTQMTAPPNPKDIRTVQVTIIVRNSVDDKNFRSNSSYTLASGRTVGPYTNGYRRRLLTTTVRCRNMGFKSL